MAKLIFRYGSMNSSKSANLIMDWYNHKQNNKDTLVFKPLIDTRSDRFVASRALQTKIEANLIHADNNGVMFKAVKAFKPKIVFVDEVQFFSKNQIEELADIVDFLGVTVQAYGLMTTFKGELFEGSKRLVELADTIERIRSQCTQCYNEGTVNSRFVDGVIQLNGQTVVVGAEETYKVLCRKCFKQDSSRID